MATTATVTSDADGSGLRARRQAAGQREKTLRHLADRFEGKAESQAIRPGEADAVAAYDERKRERAERLFGRREGI